MEHSFREGVLAGRSAMVTGGGTGLGLAISRLLASLGAKVAIASRSAEHHEAFLAEAAERHGKPARDTERWQQTKGHARRSDHQ